MTANPKNKRQHTRSRVWPDIEATLHVEDPFSPQGRNFITITGKVEDIGSSGMFLKTAETIPVPAKVELTIEFDATRPGTLRVDALAETVRKTPDGVGIHFTRISLQQLQQCILARMNRV